MAPLLCHFDPKLRTSVHIDASQHAVGAVLLQWEEGEEDPRPVCFLSYKLQRVQWKNDARNAEALPRLRWPSRHDGLYFTVCNLSWYRITLASVTSFSKRVHRRESCACVNF